MYRRSAVSKVPGERQTPATLEGFHEGGHGEKDGLVSLVRTSAEQTNCRNYVAFEYT
jgi:hypothetical protein